jgi:uncharacterized protein YjbI with pentapeptide repeats
MIEIRHKDTREMLHRVDAEAMRDVHLGQVERAEEDLHGVNLQGADLRRARLSDASLSAADLRGADL